MTQQHKDLDGISSSHQIKPPKLQIKQRPKENQVLPTPPVIHHRFRWTMIGIAVVILILGSIVTVRALNLSSNIFVGTKSSFYKTITDLIRGGGGNVKLLGEDQDQINVLLLGVGGEGHDGAYLTDTIILAQIKPKEQKVSLTAIPRDYLADLGPMGFRKLNAAFAEGYSRNKNWDEAGKAAREAVEKISGQSVPYFGVVDFKGFVQAVDLLGGVEITVDRTFTDYKYPDSNEGYLAPVTFKQGTEVMSGSRALIFTRSRHAAGPEGSDFSRSIRQQKVISAVKQKVVSLELITDLNKLNKLLSVFGNHVHTNLSPGELLHLFSLTKDFSESNIASVSLDPSSGLICPEILESNGAYVLSICPGKTKTDVQNFFKNSFNTGQLVGEKSVIWLADSTKGQLKYKRAEKQLTASGLTVYQIGYTGEPLLQTVFYQVNKKPATESFIKETFSATEVTLPPPGVKINRDRVDTVIIIGSDYNPPAETVAPTATKKPVVETPSDATTENLEDPSPLPEEDIAP